jgi:hypothetical protein
MPRRATILGLCLLAATAHAPLAAQTHKVAAPEKVTRALAVYEYTGDLAKPDAARLVPISIFIDSQLEDAGVYLAKPVPFALDAGIVYSIERAGDPIGTLDLDYARNIVTRRSATDDNPVGAWYGYGRFLSPAAEAAQNKKLHPAKPSVIVATTDSDNPDDDRPKFIRRESSTDTAAPATTRTTTAKNQPPSAPDPDADDPDRPTLRHRDPTTDDTKHKKTKVGGYVSGPSTSLNDDPDRPTVRRGTPTGVTTPTPLAGLPPGLHQDVAISDAAFHDPHPFAREWATSTEHAETLAALQTLAKPRIANYTLTNKLSPTPPSPAPTPSAPAKSGTPTLVAQGLSPGSGRVSHPAGKKGALAPAKPPTFTLTNEHLSGYSLTYGGLPTFIYTAEVPLAAGGPVYVTLVAQRLPSGELQLSLNSITDATHLDRTPWLRPIDVVDPDWSHRASLLFELRAQTTRQFALYRLVSAQAEQTFITGVIE